jgi:hypothetical protein
MDDLEVVKWVDGLANGNPRVALTGAGGGSEIEFELRLVARRISLLCDEREDRKGQATGSGRAAEAAAAAAGADTRERGNEGSAQQQRVSINGKHTATPRRRAPAEQIMKNHEIL